MNGDAAVGLKSRRGGAGVAGVAAAAITAATPAAATAATASPTAAAATGAGPTCKAQRFMEKRDAKQNGNNHNGNGPYPGPIGNAVFQ